MPHLSIRNLCLVFSFLAAVACSQKPVESTPPTTTTTKTTTTTTTTQKGVGPALGLIPRGIDFEKPPEVVAFGSCANQNKPQPIWNVIAKHNPDVFIFMGDNIYASNDEDENAADQYKKLINIPEYKSFRESFPVMAIWDDHDFGQGDGGADNPDKEYYKKEFLRHFPYVRESVTWNQGGLYHVKYIGGDLTEKKRRRKITIKQPMLQVIMLDTRYYRSPLKASATPEDPLHKYAPWDENDKTKTILGEEQWDWLEEQLKRPATLRFIVSSIQIIPNEHGFEKWGNFPYEKNRFFNLLKKHNVKNAILFSGDRHKGFVAKQDIKGLGTIYEITSSAINVTRSEPETDPTYVGNNVLKDNFGLASIDWKKKTVKVELRDINDEVGNSIEVKF